jgi:hypothetical protein
MATNLGDVAVGAIVLGGGGGSIYNQSRTSGLSLSQTVGLSQVRHLTVSSTLTLTHGLDYIGVKIGSAHNTLGFTQSAFGDQSDVQRVTQSLSLSGSATRSMVRERSAQNTITITQSARRVIEVSVSNDLSLSQDDNDTVLHGSTIEQDLTLTHQALPNPILINRTISHHILFQHHGWRQHVFRPNVSNTLAFTQELVGSRYLKSISHTLGLSHAITCKKIKNLHISSALALSHVGARRAILHIGVSSTLTFAHSRTIPIQIGNLGSIIVPDVVVTRLQPGRPRRRLMTLETDSDLNRSTCSVVR